MAAKNLTRRPDRHMRSPHVEGMASLPRRPCRCRSFRGRPQSQVKARRTSMRKPAVSWTPKLGATPRRTIPLAVVMAWRRSQPFPSRMATQRIVTGDSFACARARQAETRHDAWHQTACGRVPGIIASPHHRHVLPGRARGRRTFGPGGGFDRRQRLSRACAQAAAMEPSAVTRSAITGTGEPAAVDALNPARHGPRR